jgi:hypothetical protein
MQAIARRENLSQRRIARLVDLALLAPDLIDAIVTGRQPVSLTPDALIKSRHRPLWGRAADDGRRTLNKLSVSVRTKPNRTFGKRRHAGKDAAPRLVAPVSTRASAR